MKFKLTKLRLFLIIITAIVLSTLGFTIKEHFTGTADDAMDNAKETRAGPGRLASLAEGSNYDPFGNSPGHGVMTNNRVDPFLDNDYSKTIAGLEEDVVRDNGSRQRDAAAAKSAGIDLSKYILKSEIVPPVCPKCPDSRSCPRQKPCPPCPPPGRCPEASFECKKVPSHNAMNVNGTGPGGTGEVDSGFDNGNGNSMSGGASGSGTSGSGTSGSGTSGGSYGAPGNPSSELPMPQLNSFAKFN